MKLLNGTEVAKTLESELAAELAYVQTKTSLTPHLCVVVVGEDPASLAYVSRKEKACARLGFRSSVVRLAEDTTAERLTETLISLNSDKSVHGILLQLPLPKHLNPDFFTSLISPIKDVDGFHPVNARLLSSSSADMIPCTPAGILELLHRYDLSLSGKHVVILGRSQIVGRPLAQLCLNEDATVTVCHSKTTNLREHTLHADILISAIGVPGFVTGDMVKPGAIVIDVGINRLADGRLVGDVDFESVSRLAQAMTPVPGGVGPMTIGMLLSNTLQAALKQELGSKRHVVHR